MEMYHQVSRKELRGGIRVEPKFVPLPSIQEGIESTIGYSCNSLIHPQVSRKELRDVPSGFTVEMEDTKYPGRN